MPPLLGSLPRVLLRVLLLLDALAILSEHLFHYVSGTKALPHSKSKEGGTWVVQSVN